MKVILSTKRKTSYSHIYVTPITVQSKYRSFKPVKWITHRMRIRI